MLWHLFRVDIVFIVGAEEQMTDQVKEDKYTGTCAESYMNATRLYTKTLAHGSFNLKDVKELLHETLLLIGYFCLLNEEN